MWMPFWNGARAWGMRTFEASFRAFCNKQVVVTMGTYTILNEVYTATTGNANISRQVYLQSQKRIQDARKKLAAPISDKDSLSKNADIVAKMM